MSNIRDVAEFSAAQQTTAGLTIAQILPLNVELLIVHLLFVMELVDLQIACYKEISSAFILTLIQTDTGNVKELMISVEQ
jgi:hypothetical protein